MTDTFAVLKADFEDEPYRVEIPGKGKWEIPHVNTIDVFEMNDATRQAEGDLDATLAMLRLALPDKDFERLRKAKLNRPTLLALFDAWAKHCGMGDGPESSASSA